MQLCFFAGFFSFHIDYRRRFSPFRHFRLLRRRQPPSRLLPSSPPVLPAAHFSLIDTPEERHLPLISLPAAEPADCSRPALYIHAARFHAADAFA